MSLERPNSRASSGGRGPPPTPPPTYLWEEVRRQRSKGGYPWTILDKDPLPDSVEVELLLKGELPVHHLSDWESEEYCIYGSTGRPVDRRSRRDKFRRDRARSEPTPSIPSSNSFPNMDQAMAAAAVAENPELEEDDFPLNDEDIPDFVMEYLQSDEGNLDENIPDHILEYIQSRAAALDRSRQQQTDEDLFYTEDELRIIQQARKRLEEQGEMVTVEPCTKIPENKEQDEFDEYFQRHLHEHETEPVPTEALVLEPVQETEKPKKKESKFKLPNLSMPNKPQLNIKLPKLVSEKKQKQQQKKKKKKTWTKIEKSEPQYDLEPEEVRSKKQRRTQSSSPMRERFHQQLQSWNNSLKKLRIPSKNRDKDGQVKGFIALLPGVSTSKPKKSDIDHQYEEIRPPPTPPTTTVLADLEGRPIVTVTEADDLVLDELDVKESDASLEERMMANAQNDAEETMEEVENLPESEVVEIIGNTVIVDKFVLDDVTIQQPVKKPEIPEKSIEPMETPIPEESVEAPATATTATSTLAARSKKAFQVTKSKIQRTLSKENFQATRHKIQSTWNNTLKKTKMNKSTTLPRTNGHNIFETNTTGRSHYHRDYETSTPKEMAIPKRRKNRKKSDENKPNIPPPIRRRQKKGRLTSNTNNLIFDENHYDLKTDDMEEDELEPKLTFPLNGVTKPPPPSVSQSTEACNQDEAGSDKENVVIRPKRRRYRQRRHGFHEDFARPRSENYDADKKIFNWSNYATLSQEILETFCQKPVNSLDAIDVVCRVDRRPERPSRTKNRFSTLSDNIFDYHDYCNVPPRRMKRLNKSSRSSLHSSDWPMNFPPRENTVEMPTIPRRHKPKVKSQHDFTTWPRCLEKSPPIAPKRCRSKQKIHNDKVLEDISQQIMDIESQIENPQMTVEPDMKIVEINESRHYTVNDVQMNNTVAPVSVETEEKILNHHSIRDSNPPFVPKRRKSRTGSLRLHHKQDTDPIEIKSYEDATWPRSSKIIPQRPHRIKRNIIREPPVIQEPMAIHDPSAELHGSLEEPQKGITAPVSTPSEVEDTNDGDNKPSSIQELDQLLECLANHQNLPLIRKQTEDEHTTDSPPVPTEENRDIGNEDDIIEDPYAEIKTLQRKTPPPRPPPPVYNSPSTSSYSYIYTVPRRVPRTYHEISPERPPRTYCTIRPHRPPRKSRPRTAVIQYDQHGSTESPRRHSFSGTDDLKSDRHLQSSPVIERMRSRPLPAPPRVKRPSCPNVPAKPPRRNSTKRKDNVRKSPEKVEDISHPVIHSVNVAPPIDGYELIEAKVEEVSIAIQTDPLPEYELETVTDDIQGYELNNDFAETSEMPLVTERESERQEDICDNEDECVPQHEENEECMDNHSEMDVETPCQPDEPTSQRGPLDDTKPSNEEEEYDSYSSIPANFPLSNIRLSFPRRLQLNELEVERLNVREVQAERLVVSSLDTHTLQVSQLTSTSSPLAVTVRQDSLRSSSLAQLADAEDRGRRDSITNEAPKEEICQPIVPERMGSSSGTIKEEVQPIVQHSDFGTQCTEQIDSTTQTVPVQSPTVLVNQSQDAISDELQHQSQDKPTELRQTNDEPTVGELTLQLVSVSTRHLATAAQAAAQETYYLAKQVANMAWQILNEQFHRRGIYFDDKEEENVKLILLLLLIVITAIFLLGIGRRRIGNHWELYYPY